LDALRGIAALLVMWFHLSVRYFSDYGSTPHAFPAIPFQGLHGVYLFFMISGFVITMTAASATPRQFLVSRFSRLFPAYWVCVILTFTIVAVLGLPGREQSVFAFSVNLTMLQQFFAVPLLDNVYWSLAYELAFYAVVFVLLSAGLFTRYPHQIAGVWLACSAAYAGLRDYLHINVPEVLEILTVASFAPLFMAGMMFYQLRTHRGERLTHLLIILCLALHILLNVNDRRGWLLAVAMFCVFYLVTYGRLTVLRSRALVWLGLISYPLYLLHDNIGLASLRSLIAHGLSYDLALLITAVVVLLMAGAVSRFVERPAMKWLRLRLLPPKPSASGDAASSSLTMSS